MKKPEKRDKWTLCPIFPDTKKADMDIASYYLIQGYNIALKEIDTYIDKNYISKKSLDALLPKERESKLDYTKAVGDDETSDAYQEMASVGGYNQALRDVRERLGL